MVSLPGSLNRYNRIRVYIEELDTEGCCDKLTIHETEYSGNDEELNRYYYGDYGSSLR